MGDDKEKLRGLGVNSKSSPFKETRARWCSKISLCGRRKKEKRKRDDPYGVLFHQTARPGDLHSAVEDLLLLLLLVSSVRHSATRIDHLISMLVLRKRAQTVIPLHAAGPVGLLQGLVAAVEILAEA